MGRRKAVLAALAGAAAARLALRAATRGIGAVEVPAAKRVQAGLRRTNFRGRDVSLAGGLAYAVGAGGVAALAGGPAGVAAAVAGLGAGAVGAYDDAVGNRPGHAGSKGFRGHLAALREGRVTSGLVKIVGIGMAGMAAAGHLDYRTGRWARTGTVAGAADAVLAGALVAASANLLNLFDLRPGRALKVGLAAAVPLAAAGGPAAPIAGAAAGAAAALLKDDLREHTMLGDAGANALGALLGTAAAARTARRGRLALLAGVVALTAASEKVSFTRVIEGTPVLRELDALGRSGAAPPGPGSAESVAAGATRDGAS
jgi:UDP-N-acetylmuramyl pentapeptide phosphotransferase/UDP-N-acetylglucosamine-1-phosphate transferase